MYNDYSDDDDDEAWWQIDRHLSDDDRLSEHSPKLQTLSHYLVSHNTIIAQFLIKLPEIVQNEYG